VRFKMILWMVVMASPASVLSQDVGWVATRERTSEQRFICNTGYTLEQCGAEMAVLRKSLAKYPAAALGQWSWVLVRSEDWKLILLARKLNPNSPAFTLFSERETFIEGALLRPVSSRGVELRRIWSMPIEDLLDLAVRHELAHALCREKDEEKAGRMANLLREGKPPSCERRTRSNEAAGN
jgi:hypothetical protein